MQATDFSSTRAGRAIRTLKDYWAFFPTRLPPELTWDAALVSAVAESERDMANLATRANRFAFPRILIQPFIRREAVLSSRIEGTRASLTDLYQYESAQLALLEQDDDVREVHNYVVALDYGLQRLDSLPVSLRLIREIHGKLMDSVRGGHLTPGQFRRSQNWIGPAGSTIETAAYVPPPVEEMKEALGALELYIHADSDLPALVRAGLVHYQFEAIHPFLDGNGRVGRLLLLLMLKEWGVLPQPLLNISAYFERHRQEYYDRLLAVSQQGQWEAWLRFFLQAISIQAQDSLDRMSRLESLRGRYQQELETGRSATRMAAVIDFVFSRPILSVKQMQMGLDIPYMAAKRYVDRLVEADVLIERTGNARNRVFVAAQVLRALERTG